jgi:hypothetical protein
MMARYASASPKKALAIGQAGSKSDDIVAHFALDF